MAKIRGFQYYSIVVEAGKRLKEMELETSLSSIVLTVGLNREPMFVVLMLKRLL